MRLLPILTAILVTGFLYFLILERDRLLEFAGVGGSDAAPAAEEMAEATPAEETEENARLISVVARTSEAQQIDSGVVLRGRTEASRHIEVRAETSGLVISEPLAKGSTVAEGDLLCRLDPGTRQSALDEARARLIEAQARLPEAEARVPASEATLSEARSRIAEGEARILEARARLSEAEINQAAAARLSEGGFASETQLANADAALESARAGVTSAEASLQGIESQIQSATAGIEGALAAVEGARAGIESARAAVASAERELERLDILAPIPGLLVDDTAELGTLLQPGQPCATIQQLDPIRLVGFVPELDVGRLEVGARAGARLASGREVIGQVTYLSRSSDEQTRTFRLEVEVANAELDIRDGETVEILVEAEGQRAHLLPQSSLTLDDDGRLGIRAVGEANVVEFHAVTLLRDTVDGVWVSGLPETVDVIVTGQEYVIQGVEVDPTYEEAAG